MTVLKMIGLLALTLALPVLGGAAALATPLNYTVEFRWGADSYSSSTQTFNNVQFEPGTGGTISGNSPPNINIGTFSRLSDSGTNWTNFFDIKLVFLGESIFGGSASKGGNMNNPVALTLDPTLRPVSLTDTNGTWSFNLQLLLSRTDLNRLQTGNTSSTVSMTVSDWIYTPATTVGTTSTNPIDNQNHIISEPLTLLLLGSGLTGMALVNGRRRNTGASSK